MNTTDAAHAPWSKRPRFAPRQLLDADRLNAALDDELERQRLLNLALHGWGVVFGFGVRPGGRRRGPPRRGTAACWSRADWRWTRSDACCTPRIATCRSTTLEGTARPARAATRCTRTTPSGSIPRITTLQRDRPAMARVRTGVHRPARVQAGPTTAVRIWTTRA